MSNHPIPPPALHTGRPDLVLLFDHGTAPHGDSPDERETETRRRRAWAEVVARVTKPELAARFDWRRLDTRRLALCLTLGDAVVAKAAREETLHEFLYGGPAPHTNGQTTPLTPANRARLSYGLVTRPVTRGGVGLGIGEGDKLDSDECCVVGGGDLVDVGEFVELFPLMDEEFNKAWVAAWSSRYSVTSADLTAIRDMYGERVALVFAFEYFYFQWVMPLAAVGGIAWLAGLGEYKTWWATVVVVWAALFTAFWARRSRDLAARWRVSHLTATEMPLPTYSPDTPFVIPLTERAVHVSVPKALARVAHKVLGVETGAETEGAGAFPIGQVLTRALVTIPATVAGFMALVVLNGVVFTLDTYFIEYYSGPFKDLLSYFPMLLFLGLSGPLADYLSSFARTLAARENHRTATGRDRNLTYKLFIFHGLSAFLPGLFLTFIYLPLGGKVSWLGNPPDRNRLKELIIAVLLTDQLINAFQENVWPFIQKAFESESAEVRKKGMAGLAKDTVREIKDKFAGHNSGDRLLDQIKRQAQWETYDEFVDFSEMVVQFGNVALFSVVFPLAPVMAAVNNFFEFRSDALKFTKSHRRPIPVRTGDIGGWEDAMSTICFLSAITNATLLSYFAYSSQSHSSGPLDINLETFGLVVLVAQVLYIGVRSVANGLAESFVAKSVVDEQRKEAAVRAELVTAACTEGEEAPRPETHQRPGNANIHLESLMDFARKQE